MIPGRDHSRRRTHPKQPIALAVLLAVVLVCAAAFAAYVSIYYHGEPAAVRAMAERGFLTIECRN